MNRQRNTPFPVWIEDLSYAQEKSYFPVRFIL
jgi:hypothetical protein